jgi:hypothetical protein
MKNEIVEMRKQKKMHQALISPTSSELRREILRGFGGGECVHILKSDYRISQEYGNFDNLVNSLKYLTGAKPRVAHVEDGYVLHYQ